MHNTMLFVPQCLDTFLTCYSTSCVLVIESLLSAVQGTSTVCGHNSPEGLAFGFRAQ